MTDRITRWPKDLMDHFQDGQPPWLCRRREVRATVVRKPAIGLAAGLLFGILGFAFVVAVYGLFTTERPYHDR